MQSPDGIVYHLTVKLIADVHHVAALLGTQKIACAAYFKVTHGNLKACSELCEFSYSAQALFCNLGENLILLVHKVCVCQPVGTPYAAAKLIKLRQAVSVGIKYYHSVCVRYVKTRLHYGGGHQHIAFAVYEAEHYIFQSVLIHLSVANCNSGLRHQFRNLIGNLLYSSYPVKYHINLTASVKLSFYDFFKQLIVLLQYIGLHRIPFLRGFFDETHILDSRKGHVKGTRDRCCRQSQHIHAGFKFLDCLFCLHAETLLLVNHQKPQILELNIR